MEELSWQITALSALAVFSCMGCLWMVFFFSRRLQSSAFLRADLVDSVRRKELSQLLRDLDDEARRGPLEPKDPPPPFFGEPSQLWGVGRVSYRDVLGTNVLSPRGDSEEDKKRQAEDAEKLKKCEEWEAKERQRYAARIKLAEEQALRIAAQRVPISLDVSLLGGGWGFLLEFSTLIVIIFSILVFGILKVMKGQDIVPILAAIAGYVLGKSSKTEGGTREPHDSYPPSAPASPHKG